MKLHRIFCLFVLLAMTSGSSAFAQIAADIRGRVLDASGAAVAHAQGFFQIQLAFVGTAVVLAFVHAPQRFAVDLPVALGVKDSDYSAHDVGFLACRWVKR